MHVVRRWSAFLLACWLWLAVIHGSSTAKADKAASPARKELDAALAKNLREVINRGADLYNAGDTAGCYRLYEGALLALRPVLDHRPPLQKSIAQGLESARRTPEQFQRAFVLREVLDKIRDDLRGTSTTGGKSLPPVEKTLPPAPTRSLWERLGGQENVAKVVDDFVAAAASDSKVNFFRNDKYPLDGPGTLKLKKMLIELISTATGGPLTYSGRKMKEAHKGMGITEAEFNALAGHMQAALEKNGAKADDVKSLMSVVVATKKDIVEKKPTPEPAAKAQTVWDSLGGDKVVVKVVDDFIAAAAVDRKVNFFRNGKYKLDEAGIEDLKKKLVDQISSLTGGPREYHGKTMKEAHKGMGITEAEFNAALEHFKAALEMNGAKPDDGKYILAAVESTRKAIVEPKVTTAPPVPTPTKTLWERLGGLESVKKIVDDFAAGAAGDRKVNFTRDGKFTLDEDEAVALKKKLVEMISEASGGPLKYKGKMMKDAHQGMGISDAEFDAHASHLKSALEKNGVKPEDAKVILAHFDGMRKDIVEKKAEEKKSPDKKTDEKNSGAKKAPETKGPEKKTKNDSE